jgi:transcriptional regulator with XRE-family HTH domain
MVASQAKRTEFGDTLKTLRNSAGLTQVEVAELAGVSLQTYRNYEQNVSTPNVKSAKRIAEALNVDVGMFYGLPNAVDERLERFASAVRPLSPQMDQIMVRKLFEAVNVVQKALTPELIRSLQKTVALAEQFQQTEKQPESLQSEIPTANLPSEPFVNQVLHEIMARLDRLEAQVAALTAAEGDAEAVRSALRQGAERDQKPRGARRSGGE